MHLPLQRHIGTQSLLMHPSGLSKSTCSACMTRTSPDRQERILRHALRWNRTFRKLLFQDVWPPASKKLANLPCMHTPTAKRKRQEGIRSWNWLTRLTCAHNYIQPLGNTMFFPHFIPLLSLFFNISNTQRDTPVSGSAHS